MRRTFQRTEEFCDEAQKYMDLLAKEEADARRPPGTGKPWGEPVVAMALGSCWVPWVPQQPFWGFLFVNFAHRFGSGVLVVLGLVKGYWSFSKMARHGTSMWSLDDDRQDLGEFPLSHGRHRVVITG